MIEQDLRVLIAVRDIASSGENSELIKLIALKTRRYDGLATGTLLPCVISSVHSFAVTIEHTVTRRRHLTHLCSCDVA